MTSSFQQRRRIIDKSPQNDSGIHQLYSPSPTSTLTREVTADIDVDGSTGVPATEAGVGGGGGEECGGGLPGVTSSYSALTRATASEL